MGTQKARWLGIAARPSNFVSPKRRPIKLSTTGVFDQQCFFLKKKNNLNNLPDKPESLEFSDIFAA